MCIYVEKELIIYTYNFITPLCFLFLSPSTTLGIYSSVSFSRGSGDHGRRASSERKMGRGFFEKINGMKTYFTIIFV